MKAELLNAALPASSLGEGPSWDPVAQRLSWVDITGRVIHRFHPASGKADKCRTPSTVGFAALAESGDYVAGLQDGLYRVNFDTGAIKALACPDYADRNNRFNDGKCDRRGRLWAGTMNDIDHKKPSGAFYRFDKRGLHVQETGIFISNGLGWSPDNKTMYYTDTGRDTIWKYDYDIAEGAATNRRVFVDLSGKGHPDGLCVDSKGRVLAAQWGSWCVKIFTPDGKPDGQIDVAAPQVSCCALGGADFKTLFITTASIGLSQQKMKEAPLAGQVFAVQVDVPGLPEPRFRE